MGKQRSRRTTPGMTPRSNRCKNTIDVSSYYSKKCIWTIIDPYLINTILFILICLPTFLCALLSLPIYLISCKIILNSWTFCLKQFALIYKANYRLKGARGIIVDSSIIYAFQSFMIIFLAIDLLLFPQINHIKIIKPVFITGCARSGTTFAHRIFTTPPPNKRISSNLIQDSPYVIHALWEILCPSLTLKYIFHHVINNIDKAIVYYGGYNKLQGAYDYKLNSEAAEEGLFGMHCFAGDFYSEFLPVGFWFDLASKYLGIGVKDHWSKHHVALLKQLLQRQIFWSGKTQIVAKSPSLCWFLEDVIEAFPDCKILLLVRDPYDMIVSNLSLFKDTWTTLYGNKYMKHVAINLTNNDNAWLTAFKSTIWRRGEQSKRYMKVLNERNENKNILCVRYDDLKSNLSAVYIKCMEHFELDVDEETSEWIKEKEQKQKTRKRSHKIKPISSYRIDPEEAKRHFTQIIERWDFTTEWK